MDFGKRQQKRIAPVGPQVYSQRPFATIGQREVAVTSRYLEREQPFHRFDLQVSLIL